MSKSSMRAVFLIVFVMFSALYAGGQTKYGDKTAPFFKIFTSGTYHMKAKTTVGKTTTEVEIYCKGGMTAVVTSAEGESMRIVSKNNKTYMIFETSKMIMLAPEGGQGFKKPETEKITFTGTGTAVFAGKSLPYDEYANADGTKSQYFVDGNKLAGIRNIAPKEGISDIVISVLDQNVPNTIFDIPDGYTNLSGFGG